MSDQTVTLRLTATNGELVGAVRVSKAALGELGDAAEMMGQRSQSGFSKTKAGLDSISKQLEQTKLQVLQFGAAMLSVSTVSRATAAFINAADRAGQLEARMRLATQTQSEYNYAMERSQSVARNSYQSINQVAEVAINAAGPMRQLGFSIRDTLDLTEALSTSLVISAANQQRSTAAIDQFSKAMQTGVLRGQEFQTILQTAPRFITALEVALGKSRAELIEMANAGQLTVAELTKVSSQIALLNEEVEQMPTTVEDARIAFADAFQQWAGDMNVAINANAGLVKVIELAASAIPLLTPALIALGVAISGRLVASMSAAVAGKMRMIATARRAAQAELVAARQAEAAAAGRVAAARAGIGAAGQLAAAEAQLAAAQARTTAAVQASSVALTAKAAAARAASAAMAMFGGPVGLAVTALTAFVLWVSNSNRKARELAETVQTGFQGAITQMREFKAATADEAFAGLADSLATLDKTEELVASLQRRVAQLQSKLMRPSGEFAHSTRAELEELSAELATAEQRMTLLNEAKQHAFDVSGKLVLEQAGVTNATRQQVDALQAELVELGRKNMTLDQQIPRIQEIVAQLFSAEHAARVAAAGFRDLAQSANVDWSDLDKSLQQRLRNAQSSLIRARDGEAAATRFNFANQLADLGASGASAAEIAQRVQENERIIALEESTRRLTDAQREQHRGAKSATQDAQAVAEKARRLHEQQQESLRRYADEAALAAAQIDGPVRLAEQQRMHRVRDLAAELAKGNIAQADYNTLVQAAEHAERRAAEAALQRQDAHAALLDAMSGELQLLGMTATERERHTRMLRAEEDMRRAISEATEAGAQFSDEHTANLVRQARALASLSVEVEDHIAALEDWAAVGGRALGGFADVFADLLSLNLDRSKSFFKQLKDVFRQGWRDLWRTLLDQQFVRPLHDMLTRTLTGAMRSAGRQASGSGGWMAQLFGGGSGGFAAAGQGNGLLGSVLGWLGMGNARAAQPQAGNVFSAAGGVSALHAQGYTAATMPGMGGGMGQLAGMLLTKDGISKAAPWLAAASGAMYGWQQGGDTAGKALGAAAYGTAAYAGTAAMVAGAGAMAAGGGFAAAGTAALGAIPVVGWIALAAIAIDKISGGKLFGTKFKLESAAQQIDFSGSGAAGFDQTTEWRNRSLFRGRKWRTTTTGFDAEAQAQIDRAFDDMQKAIGQAAGQLGVDLPEFIAGSFRREFDAKGNLQREFGTIAGRVYNEAQDAFAQRLVAENLLAVAMQAGSAAEIGRLAGDYRGTPEALTEFATLMLAVQADIKQARQVWSATGDGSITRVVELIEHLSRAGESLAETYARITDAARDYGALIADADKQIRMHGMTDYQRQQVQIELGYRAQVKQAHELAKQLGLTGARSEDLAKLEQLRAISMADLQAQMQRERDSFLADLSLGALSPLRDDQKLTESMRLLSEAAATGDMQSAKRYAEAALGFGRNLYASGADYNALYAQVTGLIDGMAETVLAGYDDAQLGEIADILLAMPDQIARALVDQAMGGQRHVVDIPGTVAPAPDPLMHEQNALLREQNALLRALADNSGRSLRGAELQRLHGANNAQVMVL